MGEEVTASIHNVDLAPVLALAPTADSATPVPAPGHCAVAGNRALPHREHSVILTLSVAAVDDAQTPDRRSRYTWHSEVPTSGCC
jgi:hypothetical protein